MPDLTCQSCPNPLLTPEDQARGFHVLCAPVGHLAQRLGVPVRPGELMAFLERREQEQMYGLPDR